MDTLIAAPLSFVDIISTLLAAIAAFFGLVIADKFIEHGISAKRLFTISFLSLFVVPVVFSVIFNYYNYSLFLATGVMPIIAWIALGELLLSSDRKTKLETAVVGYLIYGVFALFLLPYVFAIIPL